MNYNVVFIIGGTGLIGSELVNILSINGYKIFATSRNVKQSNSLISWIKFEIGVDDPKLLLPYILQSNILIHNAASLLYGKNEYEINQLNVINIVFINKLLNLVKGSPINKILFSSSLSFINYENDIISENSPINYNSYYAFTKFKGEEMIKEFCKKNKLSYNLLRISSPVSNNLELMPRTVLKMWIESSIVDKKIQIYGTGSRAQDFVHVKDIAQAYYNCICRPKVKGVFNIASGNTLSMLELAKMISKKFNSIIEFIEGDGDDRINKVSIDKAKINLGYNPKFISKSAVQDLLNNL
jgi:UDP-glucose 4-epimerase